ncbi:secreted RxLR effector protein 161-like [Schistocerca piceifrons]|uniref:secreted RxLR effector protein 161-like n=1 Tax=Schistocerca piceifrons TaxID=274613 RepID=UPI001F5E7862|nr:secreted RxLR effector protein 161-like [Schistocerca piceifrons]
MEHCNLVVYPFEPGSKLQKCETKLTDEENLVLHRILYQQAVVSLLYLDQSTRLDIAYAVRVLSRFNSNYWKIHWEAVKRIMQYIKGTVNVGITFRKSGTTETEGLCDATAVSWTSKRQQTVALSTTEADYMALSAAAKESVNFQSSRIDISRTCGGVGNIHILLFDVLYYFISKSVNMIQNMVAERGHWKEK